MGPGTGPGLTAEWFAVVSLQNRFATSRFATSQSRFATHESRFATNIKSIRYKYKVDSLQLFNSINIFHKRWARHKTAVTVILKFEYFNNLAIIFSICLYRACMNKPSSFHSISQSRPQSPLTFF